MRRAFPLAAVALVLSCNGSLPPNAVPAGIATVETAICVLNVESKDAQQGLSAGTIVADCIQQCGTDAATIARILDAHHAAMQRELAAQDGGDQ